MPGRPVPATASAWARFACSIHVRRPRTRTTATATIAKATAAIGLAGAHKAAERHAEAGGPRREPTCRPRAPYRRRRHPVFLARQRLRRPWIGDGEVARPQGLDIAQRRGRGANEAAEQLGAAAALDRAPGTGVSSTHADARAQQPHTVSEPLAASSACTHVSRRRPAAAAAVGMEGPLEQLGGLRPGDGERRGERRRRHLRAPGLARSRRTGSPQSPSRSASPRRRESARRTDAGP